LSGTYEYPDDLITLKPTRHFLDRLAERKLGLDCIPTQVRVTKNNIYRAKTEDGSRLTSVVVRLKYTYNTFLFIAFNPYDGGAKTLWFRDRHGNDVSIGSEDEKEDSQGNTEGNSEEAC
jgi:hypothetical protein